MTLDHGTREAVREAIRQEFGAALDELRVPPADAGRRLVGVEEAARYLGLSTSTIYKRAERCELPSVKDGGRLLFRIADLDAYADARRRSPERVRQLAATAAARYNVIQNDQNHDGSEAAPDRAPPKRK